MTAGPTCAGCVHWDRYEHDLSREVGDCRLNPPTVNDTLLARFATPPSYRGPDPQSLEIEVDLYAASVFPVTHENSRCARHEGVIA